MRRKVERILKRYGTTFTLLSGDGNHEFSGIFQIIGAASQQNMQTEYTPLGENPQGRYLLLAPLEMELKKEDVFCKEDSIYKISRVEKVWFQQEALYYWCLCEDRGEVETWGNPS